MKKRARETERASISFYSASPRWTQWVVLGQAKAGSFIQVSFVVAGKQALAPSSAFLRPLTESWVRVEQPGHKLVATGMPTSEAAALPTTPHYPSHLDDFEWWWSCLWLESSPSKGNRPWRYLNKAQRKHSLLPLLLVPISRPQDHSEWDWIVHISLLSFLTWHLLQIQGIKCPKKLRAGEMHPVGSTSLEPGTHPRATGLEIASMWYAFLPTTFALIPASINDPKSPQWQEWAIWLWIVNFS